MQVESDGSVRVFIGNTEMGQGARSAISQITASGSADQVDFQRAAAHASALRKRLSSSGWFVSPDTSFGDRGQGNPYMTYVWSANFAEVLVDTETMEIQVVKLVAAHDVGRAVNPREVAGQIRGGALQGLGFALLEELNWIQAAGY